MRTIKKLLISMILGWLPFISACSNETLPANVVGYNHTDRDIGHFTVNGAGGGFLQAHKGGGGFVCCIGIPKHWKPSYRVTVGWTDDYDENYQERTIEVPRYDKVGHFSVHFLRNGEIKVFATMLALQHPDYPLKGFEAELEP